MFSSIFYVIKYSISLFSQEQMSKKRMQLNSRLVNNIII